MGPRALRLEPYCCGVNSAISRNSTEASGEARCPKQLEHLTFGCPSQAISFLWYPLMLDAPPVSCLIYTLNEEANLPHCLKSLRWCDDVVVVDSFSTDRTEAIAREAGAQFVQHEFTGFGDQRNWSLETITLRHPWALILDADERVRPEMAAELAMRLANVSANVGAFQMRRRFYIWGKWLRRSSLYPTWVVRLVRSARPLCEPRACRNTNNRRRG